jgi:hypothetical protein
MIRLAFSAKLDYLYRLTDNTGIRQRVRPSDPNAGYFVEQNAWALMVAIRALRLTSESGLLDYVRHYMAFVEQAQRPNGSFRACMSPDGRWQEAEAAEEAQGVVVWALGFAARQSMQTEVRVRALRCLDAALPRAQDLSEPRARAAILLGLAHWREAEPSAALAELANAYARGLASAYRASSPEWPWFEAELVRGSARLPQALLATEFRALALEGLAWLCARLERDGVMQLTWPAQAAAIVSACLAAHSASGEERFRRWAGSAYEWFGGKNAAGANLIDPDTGGCHDLLLPAGVAPGQGAEALLAWLIASEDMAEN